MKNYQVMKKVIYSLYALNNEKTKVHNEVFKILQKK